MVHGFEIGSLIKSFVMFVAWWILCIPPALTLKNCFVCFMLFSEQTAFVFINATLLFLCSGEFFFCELYLRCSAFVLW